MTEVHSIFIKMENETDDQNDDGIYAYSNRTQSESGKEGNDTSCLTQNENDDRDKKHLGVKSTAIVKYASTEMPAQYHELQPNTNLNNPPSNWLYGNSKWESYIQNVSLGLEHSFSSFRMAHGCLELTGEVDVVSDSENIKKLLKMPFSNASVSLMVHRVGNTLMLDDFDVHRHLLRQQQDDWKWLRKFFHETVLNNVSESQRDNWIARKNKSRDHLQNRNMFSKFLYYSMTDGPSSSDHSSINSVESLESSHNKTATKNSPEVPRLNKPRDLDHQRTVLWTFEDSRMLIGTDLPIFGGGTRPCVSLKLRDMKKPISVLTGLDYWLDNLMCNVPELAMCYHDNGIVQSYELIQTEEIPNMSDSRFSPNVVKDVAQNILSFLKSNATKEGHTYWLFKGHNDDVVKLYDLTTLCAHLMNDQNANPFTVPVGILLYRVARNMWIGKKCSRKKMNVIHKLLTNCLKLLDSFQYSQLVTSAHYLLTDLYVSDNTENDMNLRENDSENTKSCSEEDAVGSDVENEEDEDDDNDNVAGYSKNQDINSSEPPSFVEVTALCVHEEIKLGQLNDFALRYPNIPCDKIRCSKRAISHIVQGLKVLKYSTEHASSRKNIVEEQAQCDPNTAIPLFYYPLKSDLSLAIFSPHSSNADSASHANTNQEEDILLCSQANSSGFTWQLYSKILLLRKVSIAFYQLAKAEADRKRFDLGLKFVAKALYCLSSIKQQLKASAETSQMVLSSILCVCGDIFIALASCGEYEKVRLYFDFEADSDDEAVIITAAEEELDDFEYHWIGDECNDAEDCLNRCIKCYCLALECHSSIGSMSQRDSIVKRIGNAHNVLALYYMNYAVTTLNSSEEKTLLLMQNYTKRSQENYEMALKSFQSLHDTLNIVLVSINYAKLQRLNGLAVRECSEIPDSHKQEFTLLERLCYTEAILRYREALRLLVSRENYPQLYDNITWDLSSVYFNMASLLQDHPPISGVAQQKIEEEITDLMIKSLECCRSLRRSDSRHEPSADYRSGLILHRLAALYHNAFRNETNNQLKRKHRLEAEKYYKESFKLFMSLDSSVEILRLQLERVTLCDYQLSNQTSDLTRVKTLQESLVLILDCIPALNSLISQLLDPGSCDSTAIAEDAQKLIPAIELRLQSVLQLLTKCSAALSKKGSKVGPPLELCKSMYAKSLSPLSNEFKDRLPEIARHQNKILEEIAKIYHSKCS